MESWEKLLTQYGLPTVMVIYFMWRDYLRDKRRDTKEDAVSAQFVDLNKQQYDLTKSCIAAVTEGNELKRKIEVLIERMLFGEKTDVNKHRDMGP